MPSHTAACFAFELRDLSRSEVGVAASNRVIEVHDTLTGHGMKLLLAPRVQLWGGIGPRRHLNDRGYAPGARSRSRPPCRWSSVRPADQRPPARESSRLLAGAGRTAARPAIPAPQRRRY